MRFRVGRHLGVAALYLLAHLGLGACSSQQQQGEEDVEASEQGQEEGQESVENGGNEINNGEEVANEQGYENDGADVGEEEMANQGDMGSNDSDLQEIISDMNSQPVQDGGNATYANQAPMNNAPMNNAPMNNAPMNQAIVSDATSNAAPVAPAAVGPSAGPALPEMGSKMPYIVQRGDTLAKIATKVYGSSDKWKDISNLSGLANPSRIYPGDVVYYTLDDKSQAFATAYESVQRGSTQVQQGDTLATIAQRVYGSSGSWKSIWRQNDNINNPDKLDPGMTVYYIQAGALSAAVKEVRAKLNNVAQNIKKTLDSTANTTISVDNHSVFSTVSINAFSSNAVATVNVSVLG